MLLFLNFFNFIIYTLFGLFTCSHSLLFKKTHQNLVWIICLFTCLLLFFLTNSLFGLFTCSQFRFYSFLPKACLDYLLVYMSFTIYFYQQFVWITCLFMCPIVFPLPKPCWDYWLARMSFTIIIAYQGLVYL